jgi:ATP-dependent Clp protease ATP-binding subunit ClpB
LTEAVRRRPYQVILFDEIEKVHSDVFNVLLQVRDGGRLTDGQGRTVDFRNTIIVLTSNLGSEFLSVLPDGDDSDAGREQVMEAVHGAFRPESLNRLDEMILSHRLTRSDVDGIVDIQLGHLQALLADRKVPIELDAPARYDPAYGARPLKRATQRQLQNALASMLLGGSVADGDSVSVSAGDDGLSINGELVEAA